MVLTVCAVFFLLNRRVFFDVSAWDGEKLAMCKSGIGIAGCVKKIIDKKMSNKYNVSLNVSAYKEARH